MVSQRRASQIDEQAFKASCDRVALDGLRLATAVLAPFVAALLLSKLLRLPLDVATPMLVANAALLLSFAAAWLAIDRDQVPLRLANPIATGVVWLILADVLVVYASTPDPAHTGLICILLMGTGFFLMSTPWLIVAMALTLAASEVALRLIPTHHDGFAIRTVLLAGAVAGVLVHVARRRSHRELFEAAAAARHELIRRSATESRLRRSEEKYRTLVEESKDAIFVSRVDGTIEDLNPAAVELFGFASREAAIGSNATVTYRNPSDRDRLLAQLERDGYVKEFELALRSLDGRELVVQETASAILDQTGAIQGFRGVIRDITKQRDMERRFRQTQKMEAIGRLAGGVAHDFNNLLTVISGHTELALSQLPEGNPTAGDLQQIQGASERAALLTRQLLAFSRQQVLQPVVLDLNVVVEGFLDLLARTLGEDIEIATRLSPRLDPIRADRGQVEQVLLNLAVNAREAMPEGGRLILSTANVDLDSAYASAHVSVEPGPYVMLSVTDTGPGIDDAIKDRIFEPFFTTKGHGKGTGLGLATVYGVVKQSGGYIWAYDEPDMGAVFKVYFPRTDEEVSQEDQPEVMVRDRKTADESILVVEDDELVRGITVRILVDHGYVVLSAATPGEALAISRSHPERIELLLTDIVLPEMNGPRLAELLVADRPDLKVLYTSGYAAEVVAERHELQSQAILDKPFTCAALLGEVRRALAGGGSLAR